MNEHDALRLMARHIPGGLEVLAVRLGKSEETLRKELAGDTKFKLGLRDAVAISEMCIEAKSEHCYAFVNSLAGKAGNLVALPVREMGSKQELRGEMAGMLKECSDSFGALTEALSDDRISDNERRTIERELGELAARLQAVHRGVRENNEASKPAHLRAAA